MKKILNIFAGISLITSATSPLIGCGHHHNAPATKQQEENALVNFAQQNGIQANEINKNNWSFQNGIVIDGKENINFAFEELNNVKHSQLLKEFKGKMIYNLKHKTFSLSGEPFKTPTLIPGYYKPSTTLPSTITGNANDFTIAAGYDDLADLTEDLSIKPNQQTLRQLFKAMHWNNVEKFQNQDLTVAILYNLEKEYLKQYSQAWQLPRENYMALIHIVKINGIYHVSWTNLDSEQDKYSLRESDGSGNISSVFWKDTNYYHLWCSQQLVQEINQIYELPKANYWFQNDNLNKWLINKSGDPQTQEPGVGVQTINTNSYSKYNTSINTLDKALLNLNNAEFFNWVKSVKSHDYKNYDLAFNINNAVSFNSAESLKSTQEFN